MQKLPGTGLENFPHKDFVKVSDILYFEGPLLVHYTNFRGENYMYHWADGDDTANRWMIYRVNKQSLLEYLKGIQELRQLFLTTTSEFILFVDINDAGQRLNCKYLTLDEVPQDYLPKEGHYYELNVPGRYKSWVTEEFDALTESDQIFRQYAIYINQKPKKSQHGTYPEVPQMVELLSQINQAYVGYSVVNYSKRFGDRTIDGKKKRKILKDVAEASVLRGVDFGPGSFGVALAPDFLANAGVFDSDVYSWLKTLPKQFQTEVLDNINNLDALKNLQKLYSPEEIEHFLGPIVKIAENESYDIAKANHSFQRIAKPLKASKSIRQVLFPEKEVITTVVDEEKEVITLVVEKPKGKALNKMTGKQIVSGTLFSKPVNKFSYEVSEIVINGMTRKLKNPFEVNVDFDGHLYTAIEEMTFSQSIGVSVEVAVDEVKRKLANKFHVLLNREKGDLSEDQVRQLEQLSQIFETASERT